MLFDDVYRYVGQYKKFQIIMSLIVAFQGKFQTMVNANPCIFVELSVQINSNFSLLVKELRRSVQLFDTSRDILLKEICELRLNQILFKLVH